MEHNGLHQYRFNNNPKEKRFAEVWDEWNTKPYQHSRIVDYMVSSDLDHPDYATDRECEIIATVIQWLGSPVGQSFLEEVNG